MDMIPTFLKTSHTPNRLSILEKNAQLRGTRPIALPAIFEVQAGGMQGLAGQAEAGVASGAQAVVMMLNPERAGWHPYSGGECGR